MDQPTTTKTDQSCRSRQRFVNRRQAGEMLAEKLAYLQEQRPIVLGLARGGLPVAYPVAIKMKTSLHALVVRKLGAPQQPEFAIGALAPDNTAVFNDAAITALGVEPRDLIDIRERELQVLQQRLAQYAPYQPAVALVNRVVIIIDDGLATGMTVRATLTYIHQQNPARVIIAIPVCARETVRALRPQADQIICLVCPNDLVSVGLWYHEFSPVSDDTVIQLLQQANLEPKS